MRLSSCHFLLAVKTMFALCNTLNPSSEACGGYRVRSLKNNCIHLNIYVSTDRILPKAMLVQARVQRIYI